MEYRLPNQKDEIILNEYMAEHRKNGEKTISASLDLAGMEYGKWLENVQENAEYGSKEWGKNILYLCFDKNSLIGLLNIRYELPKDLSLIYGDIGYGVRPSQRNKGYATEMLKKGLDVCREKGMKSAILGCYKDNPASAAVIQKCGGKLFLESDNYQKGRVSQYYEIEL